MTNDKYTQIGKKLCFMALELAEALCGRNKTTFIDRGYTIVTIPEEVVKTVSRGNTIEEKMEFLERLKWSRDWAEGMCKLVHGEDWDRLPESKRKECIRRMLRILAERAF